MEIRKSIAATLSFVLFTASLVGIAEAQDFSISNPIPIASLGTPSAGSYPYAQVNDSISNCIAGQTVANGGSNKCIAHWNGSVWQYVTTDAATSLTCTVLSGSNVTLTPSNLNMPVTECFNWTLSANNSNLTFFANSSAPVMGWVGHIFISQNNAGPTGGYTLAGFTNGSGVNLVYPTTGGCSSAPTMPTVNGHALELVVVYNNVPTTPELDVTSCVQTGS